MENNKKVKRVLTFSFWSKLNSKLQVSIVAMLFYLRDKYLRF